jgi:DNA modification methylase
MAKYHQRHFLGIDISGEYCEIARKRVAAVPASLSKWCENFK